MKSIISRLTMVKTDKIGFYDIVAHRMVYYFMDCYGQEWIAHNKFSFRLKK